jgi:RND family efflux transporter MFP subunit
MSVMSAIRNLTSGIIVLVTLVVVVATIIYVGQKPPVQVPVFPPPTVSVTSPERRDICDFYDFTGRTEAIEIADVRARVEGFLQEVAYTDGAKAKKGDKLFVIDPAEYQARLDALKAKVLSAKAVLARSEVDLQRVEKAILSDAVSREEVTQRKANRDIAVAALKAEEAALAESQLQLGYTTVTAPIDGVVSRNLVDVGSLVGAQEKTLLATVTRMDPMYVYFNVSEELLLGSLQGIRQGEKTAIKVGAGSENEVRYSYPGKIDYIDSKVDPGTGTILVRGTVENASVVLLPGMFVRVRVPAGENCVRTLIDERAIRRDLNGSYIFIIGENNVVEQRYVTLGLQLEGMRQVADYNKAPNGLVTGLLPSEQYIVLGVLSARPGITVNPVPLGATTPADPNTQTKPAATQSVPNAGK